MSGLSGWRWSWITETAGGYEVASKAEVLHAPGGCSTSPDCDPGVLVTVQSCVGGAATELGGDGSGCAEAEAVQQRRYIPGQSGERPLCCPLDVTSACGSDGCSCFYSQLPFAGNSAFEQCGGVCDNAKLGDVCNVTCSGESPLGQSENMVRFVCLGGVWSKPASIPECNNSMIAPCPPVFSQPQDYLKMTVMDGVCNGASHGDECVIHCMPGYRPEAGYYSYCEQGSWVTPLNCVPQTGCASSDSG